MYIGGGHYEGAVVVRVGLAAVSLPVEILIGLEVWRSRIVGLGVFDGRLMREPSDLATRLNLTG